MIAEAYRDVPEGVAGYADHFTMDRVYSDWKKLNRPNDEPFTLWMDEVSSPDIVARQFIPYFEKANKGNPEFRIVSLRSAI